MKIARGRRVRRDPRLTHITLAFGGERYRTTFRMPSRREIRRWFGQGYIGAGLLT